MSTEEFNELGVVIGNIPLAILDSESTVINIISVSASESEENLTEFCNMAGGVSYLEITIPGVVVGAIWDGEGFINPPPPSNFVDEFIESIPDPFPENETPPSSGVILPPNT